ncbi:MAG: HDOD domain-containing protein [Candidatus Marinimicrobia bacterium]|nr:HDOD domain-containing protein [Candidatus Neomarinimicrobiota bacterium]
MEDRAKYYQDKIQSLVGLPTLPTIALEIQSIMREDKLSVIQTVPIIEQDPSLALKILKVANSAYYGMSRKVNSLRQAVVIIGMRELAGIVLGFSVLKSMTQPGAETSINWKKFWEHSVAVGHIAELLDEELGIHFSESPYSLGLLHDVGQLVLFRLDQSKFEEAYHLSLSERISMIQAEARVFGITHQQAGQWIAKRWGLSEYIQSVNGHHHDLAAIEDVELRIAGSLVQLANYIANNIRLNFGHRQLRTEDDTPEAWEMIQIRSTRARDSDFNTFLLDLEEHWSAVRDMVKLLNMGDVNEPKKQTK